MQKELDRVEFNQKYDIKAFYRARNMLVHGAEIKGRNIERMLLRMEYLTSFIIDKMLHTYSKNPGFSIQEIHEVYSNSYKKFKKDISDETIKDNRVIFPLILFSKA